jgi:hypothetical protein
MKTVAVAASAAVLTGCVLTGCASTTLPAPLSQSQVDAIVAHDNDARWAFFFGDRPEVVQPQVARIDYVSPGKSEALYKKCLAHAGVDPEYIYGFGTYNTDPSGQTQAFIAYYTCVAEHPVNPIAIGFLSDAQLGYMYDYYQQRLAPCLRSLGYDVPPAPGRQEFIDATYNGGSWDPYQEVHPTPGRHSWDFIDAQCPPLPSQVFGQRHP